MDSEGGEYDEPFYSLLEKKIIVKTIPNKTQKGHKTWEENQALLAPPYSSATFVMDDTKKTLRRIKKT